MNRILFLVVLVAGPALSVPYLISDPWPLTGPQPTSCVWQEGTAAELVIPVASQANNQVYCKIDLGDVTRAAHNWQVWARNLWGDSAKVPFSFSAVPPTAASNLRVSP